MTSCCLTCDTSRNQNLQHLNTPLQMLDEFARPCLRWPLDWAWRICMASFRWGCTTKWLSWSARILVPVCDSTSMKRCSQEILKPREDRYWTCFRCFFNVRECQTYVRDSHWCHRVSWPVYLAPRCFNPSTRTSPLAATFARIHAHGSLTVIYAVGDTS